MCLVPKELIPNLGMKMDMRYRTEKIRVDDARRAHIVNLARKLIYIYGLGIKSSKVLELLKAQSLTPTLVRNYPAEFRIDDNDL